MKVPSCMQDLSTLMSTQVDGVNLLLEWLLETRKKQWPTYAKQKRNQTTMLSCGKRNQKAQRDGHELERTMEAGKPTNRLRPAESQEDTAFTRVTRNVLVRAAAA